MKIRALSATLMIVKARSWGAAAGVLLAQMMAIGCTRSLAPADAGNEMDTGAGLPEVDTGTGPLPDSNAADHPDAATAGGTCGRDGGMSCEWSAPIEPIAGTCTYTIPCEGRLGVGPRVYANGVPLPQDVDGDSWSYTDASREAISLNGPLCAVIASGASVEIRFSSICGPIP